MSMGSGENTSDMASKEQAWGVLAEILDLLQSRAKVWYAKLHVAINHAINEWNVLSPSKELPAHVG